MLKCGNVSPLNVHPIHPRWESHTVGILIEHWSAATETSHSKDHTRNWSLPDITEAHGMPDTSNF